MPADQSQPMRWRVDRGVYSAPRTFDFATILVVTTAYAALFAMLRAVGLPITAIAVMAGFFTFVGLSQAVFFRGLKPRGASILAGALYLVGIAIIAERNNIPNYPLVEVAFVSIFAAVAGAFFGYICGVLVGSVFMAADLLRRGLYRKTVQELRAVAESGNEHMQRGSADPFDIHK